MEKDFAHFRVQRRNLEQWVTFVDPYLNSSTGMIFHSYRALEKVNPKTIILSDVLEHIPDYHLTLRFLISILQKDGKIYERSPFDNNSDGISIHLKSSMPMQQAMYGMKRVGKIAGHNIWTKF